MSFSTPHLFNPVECASFADGYRFANRFTQLPSYFYETVKPTPLLNARFIHINAIRQDLGLGKMSDADLMLWLNEGLSPAPLSQHSISTRYAGHQFGAWAGQLGDGRAISLGEIVTPNQDHYEIQTKGSGKTPFSRFGDGKAVIRSSVREYLCSEAMSGLGIPTTQVLALIVGDDAVQRECIERSAIVARVAPSFLRFGHFELAYHFQKHEELTALMNFTQQHYFNNAPLDQVLLSIVESTTKMIAHWQTVGFCHGVMNTDNFSILGLTLDYGPFGFLEETNLNHVCNHSDEEARYAFMRQPEVAYWNLERLAICFLNHLPREVIIETLNQFPVRLQHYYQQLCRKKLGLLTEQPDDEVLFNEFITFLSKFRLDYTFSFRQLVQPSQLTKLIPPAAEQDWDEWIKKYIKRLEIESASAQERAVLMLASNPKFILRNYIAEEIIQDVEQCEIHQSSSQLNSWLKILENPFDEHEGEPWAQKYALPTPAGKRNIVVSCSS